MTEKKTNTESKSKKKCGIIMPISLIDGCTAEHWAEVLVILKESIELSGFEPNLVSDADDSGIIQKRIIHNLYNNEIVVCDVSGKNPNVMFELGMRLAFDKPTIIIKDDKTDYSFDTSVIEHLAYPRDLRFSKIVKFKDSLKSKIEGTYIKATSDKNYTTFLKHFGEFKVTQLGEKEVTADAYMLSMIEELRKDISVIRRNQVQQSNISFRNKLRDDEGEELIKEKIEEYIKINKLDGIGSIFKNNKESDLISYLEQFDDVKMICVSKKNLERLVNKIILPF